MKTKKLLSVLSAAAIAGSAFAGLTVTASAAEIDLTYAGEVDKAESLGTLPITLNGGGRWNDSRNTQQTILNTVSDEFKAMYDADGDGYIDTKYVSRYANFIGNGVTVSIDVNLEPGAYTLYYGGTSKDGFYAQLDNGVQLDIASRVEITSSYGVYPMLLILDESYNGKITIGNNSSYLPDLYSLKLIDTPLNTQNDVITAADVIRGRSNVVAHTSYTTNPACTDEIKAVFGENLEYAGYIELTHTDEKNDHLYIDITKDGNYAIDILGGNGTSTALTFTRADETGEAVSISLTNSTSIATAENDTSIQYFASEENVELTSGIYEIHLGQVGTARYYTNFIAMALREVSDPEPQPETLDMKNEGVAEGTGANTGTYATMFSAKVEDFNGTAKTVAVTSGENTRSFDVDGTVLTDATAIYGLIVNGLNDGGAEAVITFE